MADPIVSSFDATLYSIRLKNLEKIYFITRENNAVLKLLIDWICETNNSLEKIEDRERIMPVLYLAARSIKKIERLLPPL